MERSAPVDDAANALERCSFGRDCDRLARDPGFEAAELRSHLEDLDDGDDEIPPVAWGEPLDRWEHYSDDSDWSWVLFFGGAT